VRIRKEKERGREEEGEREREKSEMLVGCCLDIKLSGRVTDPSQQAI
jgi:hypothetical protein